MATSANSEKHVGKHGLYFLIIYFFPYTFETTLSVSNGQIFFDQRLSNKHLYDNYNHKIVY